jgi:hypothetical protein
MSVYSILFVNEFRYKEHVLRTTCVAHWDILVTVKC